MQLLGRTPSDFMQSGLTLPQNKPIIKVER